PPSSRKFSTIAASRFLEQLPAAIRNPHRRCPDDLAVLLFAADIVVTGPAALGGRILPRELNRSGVGFGRVHILVVLHDDDSDERRRPLELHGERRRTRRLELFAHEVLA